LLFLGFLNLFLGIRGFAQCLNPVKPTPYLETFDGANWQSSSSGFFDPCWSRQIFQGQTFRVGEMISNNEILLGNHTVHGRNYLYARRAPNSSFYTISFTSPQIDLSNLNDPQLRFFYHIADTGIGLFKVNISHNQGVSFDSIYSFVNAQQTSFTDPWREALIDLSAYAGDTVMLQFTANRKISGATTPRVCFDDIEIREKPLCPRPDSVQVTFVSATTANIQWVSGGANSWQVEYGPAGYAPGSGTKLFTTSTSMILSGLTGNTNYDVYVRDSCGSDGFSFWSEKTTFYTPCPVCQTPYFEDFDGPNFSPAVHSSQIPGNLDSCWKSSLYGQDRYVASTSVNSSAYANPGPWQDHTTGQGKFVHTIASFSNNPHPPITLTTPLIDLSNLGHPQLRFWRVYKGFVDSVQVIASHKGASTVIKTFIGPQNPAGWTEDTVSLLQFGNDTVQLIFKGYIAPTVSSGTTHNFCVALDDISIQEYSTCRGSDLISLNNAGVNHLNIRWLNGQGLKWEIGYKKAGTSDALIIQPATSKNNFIIPNLEAGTNYRLVVRDSCLSGWSSWSQPFFLSTQCGYQEVPYQENFNSFDWLGASDPFYDTISPCWQRNLGGVRGWYCSRGGAPDQGLRNSASFFASSQSTKFIRFEYPQAFNTDMTSPEIILRDTTAFPKLYFKYYNSWGPGDSVKFEVVKNGQAVQVGNTYHPMQYSYDDFWYPDSIDLTPYRGDTIAIRISGFKNSISPPSGFVGVDDLVVDYGSDPCPLPNALWIRDVGTVQAEIQWDVVSDSLIVGISPLGSSTWQDTVLYARKTSHIFKNLLPQTTYVIRISNRCRDLNGSWLTDTITTKVCPAVTAGFTADSIYGLSVRLQAYSNNGNSFSWDFGGTGIASDSTVWHTFPAGGIYPVRLVSYNDCGSSDTIVQDILVCDTPSASISITLLSLDSVFFVASSNSFGITSYNWDFGDGTAKSGSQVAHVYQTYGTYPVSLIITDTCGNSVGYADTVTICPPAPTASWNYQILGTTTNGMNIQFSAAGSAFANTYQWDFGDGTQDTGIAPVHTFATASLNYKITLEVKNACNTADSLSATLKQIGIEDHQMDEDHFYDIYPNPTSGWLNISWGVKDQKVMEVLLIDKTGRVLSDHIVSAEEAEAGKLAVDLSVLAPGSYFVQVKSQRSSSISHIIKF